jgi:hypothetical protein
MRMLDSNCDQVSGAPGSHGSANTNNNGGIEEDFSEIVGTIPSRIGVFDQILIYVFVLDSELIVARRGWWR